MLSRSFNNLLCCLIVVISLCSADYVTASLQNDTGTGLQSSSAYLHKSDDLCLTCHKFDINLPLYSDFTSTECSVCHENGFLKSSITDWIHPLRDAAIAGNKCVDCHVINEQGDVSIPEVSNDICLGCHEPVSKEFHLLSHHPLGEGLVSCSDCHPIHGERFTPILAQSIEYQGALPQEWHDPLKQNAQCLGCHPWFRLTSLTGSEFVIANSSNLHKVHMEEGFIACIECHAPHGSVAPKMIREILLGSTVLLFNRGEGWGTCSTTCHSKAHIQVTYGSDPQMLSSE